MNDWLERKGGEEWGVSESLRIFSILMDESRYELRGAFGICTKCICKQVMTLQNEYQRETKNSGVTREAGLNQIGNVMWPACTCYDTGIRLC